MGRDLIQNVNEGCGEGASASDGGRVKGDAEENDMQDKSVECLARGRVVDTPLCYHPSGRHGPDAVQMTNQWRVAAELEEEQPSVETGGYKSNRCCGIRQNHTEEGSGIGGIEDSVDRWISSSNTPPQFERDLSGELAKLEKIKETIKL